jgi:4-hydroxy-2-oxoheptanedioate aldolase
MRVNGAKAKAKAGEVALGAALPFNSPDLVEVLGALGLDFVTLDLEHEPFDELAIVHCIRAAEVFDITPIVRLPNDENLILRLLDAGAQGVHVPRINTARDAQLVVDAARFYPQGKRTFYATGRTGNYGLGATDEEHACSRPRSSSVSPPFRLT